MAIKYNFRHFKIPVENIVASKTDERHNRIVLTPYEFYDNYDTFINVDYSIRNINLKYAVINAEIFHNVINKLNTTTIALLFAIINNLENDTNLVKFNVFEYARIIGRTPANVSNCFKDVFDYNLLAQTNKNSTYIINHNAFFKGDLNKFAKDYKELYGDRKVEYTNNGKIILTN